MFLILNKNSFHSFYNFIIYLLTYITYSNLLLFYILICGIFFYPTLPAVFPAFGVVIAYLRYVFILLFLFGLLLHTAIYKNFNLYIDNYIILITSYIICAGISIAQNSNSTFTQYGLQELYYTFFSFLSFIVFIQTLKIIHIKKIGNVFIAIALINIIISFTQIYYFRNVIGAHVSALLGDNNMFARFLIIVNSFLLINYFSHGKKKEVTSDIFLMLLIFISISLLYSRSGYVLYILSVGLIIWQTKNKFIRKLGIYTGTFVLVLFTILTYQRIKRDFMDIKNSSDIQRMTVIKTGINMIKRHPIFGVGYGMARFRYREFEDKSSIGISTMYTIHNIYINIFAEQGVVGLLFYLLFNFGLLYELYKRGIFKEKIKNVQNELFCFIALSAYMVHGIIYHSFDSEGYYWVIAAACIIVLKENKLKTLPSHPIII